MIHELESVIFRLYVDGRGSQEDVERLQHAQRDPATGVWAKRVLGDEEPGRKFLEPPVRAVATQLLLCSLRRYAQVHSADFLAEVVRLGLRLSADATEQPVIRDRMAEIAAAALLRLAAIGRWPSSAVVQELLPARLYPVLTYLAAERRTLPTSADWLSASAAAVVSAALADEEAGPLSEWIPFLPRDFCWDMSAAVLLAVRLASKDADRAQSLFRSVLGHIRRQESPRGLLTGCAQVLRQAPQTTGPGLWVLWDDLLSRWVDENSEDTAAFVECTQWAVDSLRTAEPSSASVDLWKRIVEWSGSASSSDYAATALLPWLAHSFLPTTEEDLSLPSSCLQALAQTPSGLAFLQRGPQPQDSEPLQCLWMNLAAEQWRRSSSKGSSGDRVFHAPEPHWFEWVLQSCAPPPSEGIPPPIPWTSEPQVKAALRWTAWACVQSIEAAWALQWRLQALLWFGPPEVSESLLDEAEQALRIVLTAPFSSLPPPTEWWEWVARLALPSQPERVRQRSCRLWEIQAEAAVHGPSAWLDQVRQSSAGLDLACVGERLSPVAADILAPRWLACGAFAELARSLPVLSPAVAAQVMSRVPLDVLPTDDGLAWAEAWAQKAALEMPAGAGAVAETVLQCLSHVHGPRTMCQGGDMEAAGQVLRCLLHVQAVLRSSEEIGERSRAALASLVGLLGEFLAYADVARLEWAFDALPGCLRWGMNGSDHLGSRLATLAARRVAWLEHLAPLAAYQRFVTQLCDLVPSSSLWMATYSGFQILWSSMTPDTSSRFQSSLQQSFPFHLQAFLSEFFEFL